MLSELLQEEGYAVTVAANYQTALHQLQNNPFQLVLLDLSVPHPHNIEVIEAVRQQADELQPNLVLMSTS